VLGHPPHPPHIQIPSRTQGFFITFLGPGVNLLLVEWGYDERICKPDLR
jgi:hypothetical protein